MLNVATLTFVDLNLKPILTDWTCAYLPASINRQACIRYSASRNNINP
jgi:hypothetical protein